jgi:GntR family transcriptional repressor for pyruvate dehydrogenase complex
MTNELDKMKLILTIRESDIPVGAAFLSEKLNIPPATIGRMLAKLEKDGLLEKVSNKGRQLTNKGIEYLIEEKTKNTKLKTANTLINMVENSSKERLIEILDVRRILESKTIELACQNANDEDIAELDNILDDHSYVVRHGDLGSDQDLKLHLTIAKISKNKTINHILKLILTEEDVYAKFSYLADHVKNIQLQQHSDLVEAIRCHDPEAGILALEKHLDQVIFDVNRYYK